VFHSGLITWRYDDLLSALPIFTGQSRTLSSLCYFKARKSSAPCGESLAAPDREVAGERQLPAFSLLFSGYVLFVA
jgi:hypothetical protein